VQERPARSLLEDVDMRISILLRFAAVALLGAVFAYAAPAQDQGSDDVAAAARKAREQQQKNADKPKKVLTNDDIPSVKTDSTAPSADAASKDAGAKGEGDKAAAGEKPEDPNSEAAWRKRFQELHDKISNAEKELDVLQRELDKDQVQYYSDPQQAMTQQNNRSDINDKTAKVDAKKKEIDSLNQQLSDLEDELRKSGGDPGWAR
jgi:chromosome segregation ATPase